MRLDVLDVRSTGGSPPNRTELRLQLALEAGRLGSWEFDVRTRVLTSSAQCKANHGLPPHGDLQLEADLLPAIDPEYRDAFRAAIETAIDTRGSFEIEVPHRWPDGSHHWLLVAGRVVGDIIVGVSRDVTDQHAAKEALLEADRRKDEFLAVLGHELRNPLAPILTAARILQLKGPPIPELTRARDTIVRQTMQLAKLVDDLLDISRIASGKLHLEKTRVDLNALIRQAAETCTPAIERRQQTLEMVLPDGPIHLDADAGRIVQVVSNLLNNASKYMRDGGRIVMTASQATGVAVVRVRDEGVGIAPELLDRIFDRFMQVGTSSHLRDGGIGVGLSLVRALVELHGGLVTAQSGGIGCGSEFTVRLPLHS